MLRSRAAQRHTGAALTAPEAAINFRSQLRLCFAAVRRSIAPSFHFTRYFPPYASVPFHKYLGTVGPHNWEWQSPESRFARLYALSFSPSFELRLYSRIPYESALVRRS